MFIGRSDILQNLDKCYRDSKSHLVVCYGRRRIGKTELIQHFCQGKKNVFFYSSLMCSQKEQISNFLKCFAAFVKEPLIARIPCRSWPEVFDIIAEKLPHQKTIFVIDELQWICKKNPSFLSLLQHLWDLKWQKNNRIHLILCSSSVSFILSKVLSRKSPLFGRRTLSLELGPLSCLDSQRLMGHTTPQDAARALMCFGGVPAYLLLYNKNLSFERNLNKLAFCSSGYFVDEIKFVLSEQLNQPAIYYKMLRCLVALRKANLQTLSHELQTAPSSLLYNLERLISIGMIQEDRPLTLPETAKTLKYHVCDEYVRFYFLFIDPHLNRIRQNENGFILNDLTRANWSGFLGLAFERFCHKNIKPILAKLNIQNTYENHGTYWHRSSKRLGPGVQIDLVIETADKTTYLAECRWTAEPVGYGILNELDEKLSRYPNPKKHKLRKLLVSASGTTAHIQDHPEIDVVTLEDFFT